MLKSGCQVEGLELRTAARLQRAITINAVIAWRIMVMTLLGRQVLDCAAELLFTEAELAFLGDYAHRFGLGRAVRLVARLGGYRARKQDPGPGHQIMWRGYERLTGATLGHEIGFESGENYVLGG